MSADDLARVAYETYVRRMYGAGVFERTTKKTFDQLSQHQRAVWRDVAVACVRAEAAAMQDMHERMVNCSIATFPW